MKKVAILACTQIRRRNICPGDVKCLVAAHKKEGEFERYKEDGVVILGIVDCGGCEGQRNRAVASLATIKGPLTALNEQLDALHIGTCIMKFCPRKDDILQAVKEKAGIEVIEGTHPYAPSKIFA